jgi:hypothetical protein
MVLALMCAIPVALVLGSAFEQWRARRAARRWVIGRRSA